MFFLLIILQSKIMWVKDEIDFFNFYIIQLKIFITFHNIVMYCNQIKIISFYKGVLYLHTSCFSVNVLLFKHISFFLLLVLVEHKVLICFRKQQFILVLISLLHQYSVGGFGLSNPFCLQLFLSHSAVSFLVCDSSTILLLIFYFFLFIFTACSCLFLKVLLSLSVLQHTQF